MSNQEKMNALSVFAYQGNAITFEVNGNVMVNATQMAKSFGKKTRNWLDLPSTTQFIDTLIAVRKSDRSELVKAINGVGTWMHEDVALEFARWLSPAFAIWCDFKKSFRKIWQLQRYCLPLRC